MSRVFISHASANKGLAVKLAADLMLNGFPVWIDVMDLGVGSDLDGEISEGIRQCSVAVVLLSPNAVESCHVKREISFAIDGGGTTVLPVVVEECEVPEVLAGKLFAPLEIGYARVLRRLIDVIGRRVPRGDGLAFWLPLRFEGRRISEERLASYFHAWCVDGESAEMTLRTLVAADPLESACDALAEAADLPSMRGLVGGTEGMLIEKKARVERLLSDRLVGCGLLHRRATVGDSPDCIARAVQHLCLRYWQLILAELAQAAGYYEGVRAALPDFVRDEQLVNPFGVEGFNWRHGRGQYDGVERIDIWPQGRREASATVSVWVPNDGIFGRGLIDYDPGFPDVLASYWCMEVYEYVVPEMVFSHLTSGGPLYWSPENLLVGIH